MKKSFNSSGTAILFGLLAVTGSLLSGGAAWGQVALPPPTLQPLNQIAVPEPQNVLQFVKNRTAAIRLGKALFWDMQAGSDGVQACASCHFSAGADNRRKNTVNPGAKAGDTTFQVRGPNQTLLDSDFPFHQRQTPDIQASPILRDSNDVVGSQGVRFNDFLGINAGSAEESGAIVPDPVFQAGGVNMRRVTARNTPTNINAVFNFTNFWDGRAHFLFNGVNPFGPLDQSAGVWFNRAGSLVKEKVAIDFASLASQATGPPMDDVEMSFRGRTFPQLGKKMLTLTPIGKQVVHPGDNVLGPIAKATQLPNGKVTGDKGLRTNYADMIRAAFPNNLWDSLQVVTLPEGQFTQMEANFSLFWGLAIQLYQATLVSDQTPFDRFLGGDRTALTPEQQDGFNIFFGAGRCNLCHGGSEMTNATVAFSAFLTNANNALIEQITLQSNRSVIYDDAFNNTAVRPTTEDPGRGGTAPFINQLTGLPFPLSFVRLAELQALGSLPFATPILPDQFPANFPTGADGFFKVPGLRNVELTGPYMHNGGMRTLEEVVEFYTRGGDFPAVNLDNLDPNITQIGNLQNAPDKKAALVAFMKSLTDERVRNESAPFDHPELFIPEGDPEVLRLIPARDADGQAAQLSAFSINPVVTPTNQTSQLISGSKEAGMTIQATLNGQPVTPVTAADTTWSVTLTGLAAGDNSIAVTATDAANVATTLTATITVDTVAPLLTINAVATPVRITTQTISGTVEAGITPAVTVSTAATVGPVVPAGATWNAQISGLRMGANNITVTATDPAGNVTSAAASIVVSPDGIFNGTTVPDISDAVKALRISVGLITPTADDLQHGDVAPLGAPDGKIDLMDVVMIMRNVVGSVSL